MNRIRLVAAVSGVYDACVGLAMLGARPLLQRVFGVPPPVPAIHADLNGVFLIAVAAGYLLPYRDPEHGRGYLWTMGPLLKGGGALAFVLDYVLRGSPPLYLLFAVTDGSLAAITLWALLSTRPSLSNPA